MKTNNKINYKDELKGVICDWAGTTVDFGSLSPVAAFEEAFKKFGFDVSREEIRSFMGMLKIDHTREILNLTKERFKARFGAYPTEDSVNKIYSSFEPSLLNCVRAYSKPIRGVVEFAKEIRAMGLKLGSTTGYTAQMMEIVTDEAKKQGYAPDFWIAPTPEIPGRPHPYMMYKNAIELQIYPMSAIVKIGDTVSDIKEALNAGCWSIGVAVSGNELGLSGDEMKSMAPEALKEKIDNAYMVFENAGAHYVIDGIWDALPIIHEINERIKNGDQP